MAYELDQFISDCRSILERDPGPRVKALMKFEIERAWKYYAEAAPLVAIVSADSRPALWAMMALYSGILKRIEASPLQVFRRRVELSDMEKFNILMRGLWMRFVNSSAPMPSPF